MEKRRVSANALHGVSFKYMSLVALTIQFSTFVLLLHYSRVTSTTDGARYLPSTAVLLAELIKLTICLTISLYEMATLAPRSTSATSLLSALTNAVFSGDSWKMALPAGLYTLANSLQFVAISNLDATTFHITYQLKIVVVATLCVMMLGKTLSGRQWASLVLLMAGVALVSWPNAQGANLASNHHIQAYIPRAANPLRDHLLLAAPGPHLARRSATYEGIAQDEALLNPILDMSSGLVAVVAVCVSSGMASVFFEKVIKTSHIPTSLWIRNVQISTYSLFPAFFVGVLFLDGEQVARNGFFAGYDRAVLAAIVVQSMGGIIASFCLLYADNILKTFAVSISMVLSAAMSIMFFDFDFTSNFAFGAIAVLGATYLYGMQEGRPMAPAIRLTDETETVLNLDLNSEKDVSILIPRSPLSAEQHGLSTSRPSSPAANKKRKG